MALGFALEGSNVSMHLRRLAGLCLFAWLLCVPFRVGAEDAKKKPKKAKQKATAAALVKDLEKGVAFSVRAARQAKLDAKQPMAKPLFAALKQMSLATDDLQKAVDAKDKAFFTALEAAGKAAGLLRVAAPRVGGKHKDLNTGVKTVLNAYSLLRGSYGREAVRAKRGKQLSEKETQQIARLNEKTAAFLQKLSALEKQVAGNARMLKDLQDMQKRVEKIQFAKPSLESLLTALIDIDEIETEWVAYEIYVPTEYRVQWNETTVLLDDLDNAADEYEVSIEVESFAYFEESTEFSEEIDVSVEISETELAAEETYIEEQEVSLAEEEHIELTEECEASIDENEAEVDEDEEAIDDEEEDDLDGDDSDDDDDDDDDDGGDDDGDDDDGDDDDGDE